MKTPRCFLKVHKTSSSTLTQAACLSVCVFVHVSVIITMKMYTHIVILALGGRQIKSCVHISHAATCPSLLEVGLKKWISLGAEERSFFEAFLFEVVLMQAPSNRHKTVMPRMTQPPYLYTGLIFLLIIMLFCNVIHCFTLGIQNKD